MAYILQHVLELHNLYIKQAIFMNKKHNYRLK